MPAISTESCLLVTGVVSSRSLAHMIQPLYIVFVHQDRSLQSRFLHRLDHSKSACDLLMSFTNSLIRDFHPQDNHLSMPSSCQAHALPSPRAYLRHGRAIRYTPRQRRTCHAPPSGCGVPLLSLTRGSSIFNEHSIHLHCLWISKRMTSLYRVYSSK